jgi:hypothetical protein
MPTFQGLVSEEQVNALVAYMKAISLSKPVAGARTSASRVVSGDSSESEGQTRALANGGKVQ